MADGAAGCAARAVLRRRRRTGGASGTACCTASGSAPGGCRRTGWTSGPAERLAVVDVAGESVLVTRTTDGRAARVLQRLPPPRLAGRARRPGSSTRRRRAARRRCAAPTTPGPTTSTAGCCARRTPRTSTDFDPADFGLHPVAVGHVGRLPVPAPDAGLARAARCRSRSARRPDGSRATRSTRSSSARRSTYDVARQLQGRARELQRVLPLRRRAPRAGAARAGVRPAAAATSTGTTASRTARAPGPSPRRAPPTRAPFAGPRRRRAGAAQGRAALSQPDAEPVRRPRRRVHALADRGAAATRIVCDLLFAPDEVARDAFDPSRRGRLLGPGQPAGLGDLRVGAARHVLARPTRRAGSRRWRTRPAPEPA